jgi:lipoprotein NlpD
VVATRPPRGTENAGKPGYFTVRPGDTLIRIGLETGQNWRDVARWSGMDNPNLLEVGDVLRIAPPGSLPTDRPGTVASTVGGTGTVAVSRPVAPGGEVAGRPLAAASSTASSPATSSATPASNAAAAAATAAATAAAGDDIRFQWPVAGNVLANFDGAKVLGLQLGGKTGDPVLAAAGGQVVYVGSALRTYGNMVVIKHNSTFLTAYAHNSAIVVKEDQIVKAGQKIAEMGQSDTDRVKLHFEIRRNGKPVDPSKLLPPR